MNQRTYLVMHFLGKNLFNGPLLIIESGHN